MYVAVSLGSAAAAGEFWPAPPCGQPSPRPADPLGVAPIAGTRSVKTIRNHASLTERYDDLQVGYDLRIMVSETNHRSGNQSPIELIL